MDEITTDVRYNLGSVDHDVELELLQKVGALWNQVNLGNSIQCAKLP